MSVLDVKFQSSVLKTVTLKELSMYGPSIIGYFPDLTNKKNQLVAVDFDMMMDIFEEKGFFIHFITRSENNTEIHNIKEMLGIRRPVYCLNEVQVYDLGFEDFNSNTLFGLNSDGLAKLTVPCTKNGFIKITK